MTRMLPSPPDLELLKREARNLVKDVKSEDPAAVQRIQANLPRLIGASNAEVAAHSPSVPEAQLVIAREHGFLSWPLLMQHIESAVPDPELVREAFKKAVRAGQTTEVRVLVNHSAFLQENINETWFAFNSPAILVAANQRNRELVDVLLSFGANINVRSQWWAGGFGVLPCRDAEFAAFLISRGAIVDVHAAAGLDMLDRLSELITSNPDQVNARGGDGQTPLHFASSIRVAKFLLDHGADIEARDLDHGSTPAQYMAVYRPEICKFLLEHGATADIFMAVQLDDIHLVRKLIKANPGSVRARVGVDPFTSGQSAGGHVYGFTLSNGASPLYLAADLHREEIYELLLQHATPAEQLVSACLSTDPSKVTRTLEAYPDVLTTMEPAQRRAIADASWAHKTEAVRLMVCAGFDLEAQGDDESTALDRASVRGYVDLISLLIQHGASVEAVNAFGGSPLGAAIWGAENFRDTAGDYPAAVQRLLEAGAAVTAGDYPCKVDAVNEVLRRHLEKLSRHNINAAILLGKTQKVARMLAHDPELAARKTSGRLPLAEAMKSDHQDIVALLLEHGADPNSIADENI